MKYLFILLFLVASTAANSQKSILRRIKDRTKEKAKEKINQTADNAVDSLIEKTASLPGEIVENKGDKKDDFFSSSNFDFKPGTALLFFDDFSNTAVGDFPENWYTNSSGEIVNISNNKGKWFKLLNEATYKPAINAESGFPQMYTIEFDAVFKADLATEAGTSTQALLIDIYAAENDKVLSASSNGGTGNGARFSIEASNVFKALNWKDGTEGTNSSQTKDVFTNKDGKSFRVSIWIKNKRGRLYIDKTKVLDIPFFIPEGIEYNAVSIKSLQPASGDLNFISKLRIAGLTN